MRKSKTPDFYNKLTPQFRAKLSKLDNASKLVTFYKIIEYSMMSIGAAIIIFIMKDFTASSFNNRDIFIVFAVGLMLALVEKISKEPKESFKKNKESVRNNLIGTVCTCGHFCNCKDEVLKHMKSRKIDILN